MTTISIWKAQRIDEKPIDDLVIVITSEIPALDRVSLEVALYVDAEKLERALHNALPGGLYDRLLGQMLKRTASLYVVPRSSLERT